MVSIVCWNVRGINIPSQRNEVKSLILRYNVVCVALVEAKAKAEDFVTIARNCSPNRD